MTAPRPLSAWDPGQYLKFGGERLRPALDLLVRVMAESPRAVYDLGCGPGTVTALIRRRWPEARVVGVDSSYAMLDMARAENPGVDFVQADIAEFVPDAPADVIVSNAALHWLSDHARQFPALVSRLAPGGTFAAQMPHVNRQTSHLLMAESAEAGPWRTKARAALPRYPDHDAADYYGWLAPHSRTVEVWETVYHHALAGENPVLEWMKGAALRPMLAALPPAERDGFLADYGARLARAYPRRADGATLFPFHRLFIVATT